MANCTLRYGSGYNDYVIFEFWNLNHKQRNTYMTRMRSKKFIMFMKMCIRDRLKTTPTPFCILDEVEAALDDMNIDRFAKYLRKFNDIQFAIVTHQKATMEHADVLYGVTMPEQGISKVLSLRLGDNFDL